MLAAAAAVILVAAMALTSSYLRYSVQQAAGDQGLANQDHVLSEIADLHVETLASSSPVDVSPLIGTRSSRGFREKFLSRSICRSFRTQDSLCLAAG